MGIALYIAFWKHEKNLILAIWKKKFYLQDQYSNICLILNITLLLLSMFLFFPSFGNTQTQGLQKEIEEKKKKILENKKSLKKLNSREKKLYSDISRFEKRIQELSASLGQREKGLNEIKSAIEELKSEHIALQKEIKNTKKELLVLIRRLWPLYVHRKHESFLTFGSWKENQRNFTWLQAIFDYVQNKVQQLRNKKSRLAENLREQKQMEEKKDQKISEIQSTKEELVQKKLQFLQRVRGIRAEKVAKKEQLEQIRKTIDDLQYKLKLKKTRKISNLKGYLPWPVEGEKILDFNQRADPPQEGIGFSLDKRETVRAVSVGEVVYNDTLRGFGEVIILFHGQQYYSLYAFLSDSNVKVGEEVEQSQSIGNAGFYPECEGPGLYFELRRGQQPIDPIPWLQDRSS